ncbi:MAG: hypothetical protein K9L17_04125 [Clostridiales bacterium]|nr:hypothetical protein [Clostridiales bacterium]MCF8021867.1 hypothetical protein [Clostridiales bacterium]
MFDKDSPYTLFLILILLLLSTDKGSEAKLMLLKQLVDRTAYSLTSIHEGINSLQFGFKQKHEQTQR